MVDDGVLESEKVSSECRLERLRLEDEEVEGLEGRNTRRARENAKPAENQSHEC